MLCKRDDVENKINNKFCMQQHYETIANPTTCLALLLSASPPSSLLPLCLRVGGQTAIGIFIACSTRRMRNMGTRLRRTDVQRARSSPFFMASFDLCTIKCHKTKLNKRNVKLIYTYRLQFLSENLPCHRRSTRTKAIGQLIQVTDNCEGWHAPRYNNNARTMTDSKIV